jgi:hypothetical protein
MAFYMVYLEGNLIFKELRCLNQLYKFSF